MKKRVIALTLAMILGISFLPGCSNKSADDDVIKIGVFEPLTGENGGG
ncbi:MAG TPA: amino acid ABC transporter substrate-binding protein, partial [Clostridium sp.]|nr:amino acid ABC transporter substrate-binding protein [Clostridium sp.]